ncbi:MAG: hypothetical protein V4642_01475 [Bacteroidota bacterium]
MQRKFYPLSFLFAFVFAIAFWGYVNLNSTYTTLVETVLKVKVANGRAIEDALPEVLRLRVRGTGYELVKLLYFSARPECYVDVSPKPLESSRERYFITQDTLLRSITTPLSVQILDVSPPSISFRTDVEISRKVPIIPDFDINYRRGFTLITDPVYTPDSIEIRGTNRLIQSIEAWRTQPIHLQDVHEPFSFTIPLKDSLTSTVRKSSPNVSISGNVQQVAEITFQDVPVEIQSAPSGAEHTIRPRIVSVTVRGGIRQLQYMLSSMVRVSVSYYDLTQDSTGYVKPIVSLPPELQLVKISPAFLRHTVTKKVLASELNPGQLPLNILQTKK